MTPSDHNPVRHVPLQLLQGVALFVVGTLVGHQLGSGSAIETPVSAQTGTTSFRSTFGVGQERMVDELRELNRTVKRIEARLTRSNVQEDETRKARQSEIQNHENRLLTVPNQEGGLNQQ